MTAKQFSLGLLIILSPMPCSASFRDIFRKQEVPKMHPAKTAEFQEIRALLLVRLRNTSIELDKAQLHANPTTENAHPTIVPGCLNCEKIEILKGQKAGSREVASIIKAAILCSEENGGAEINATFQAARGSANRLGGTGVSDDEA
ncbi:MAG TPA: hypothetical protein VGT41_01500 [Candidatus Babeliales bacterium]|nr:hypothetical protein [Candidatus Babeliales bacterium]